MITYNLTYQLHTIKFIEVSRKIDLVNDKVTIFFPLFFKLNFLTNTAIIVFMKSGTREFVTERIKLLKTLKTLAGKFEFF